MVQPRSAGQLPFLINPGSVGQPRDGNPMAAFATWISGAEGLYQLPIGSPTRSRPARQDAEGEVPDILVNRLAIGY